VGVVFAEGGFAAGYPSPSAPRRKRC